MRERHTEPWKMLLLVRSMYVVQLCWLLFSSLATTAVGKKALDSLPRIYSNLILHCFFFVLSHPVFGRPASQYCVSMASFPFLQTITFGIELIAHVLKIEHAIEADANHDQVYLVVVYVRRWACAAMYNDDLLMINRIRNTSTALAKKNQTRRCNAHYCFPFHFLLLYVCSSLRWHEPTE